MWCHIYPHDIIGLLRPLDDHFSIFELVLTFDIAISKIGNDIYEGFFGIKVFTEILSSIDIFEGHVVTIDRAILLGTGTWFVVQQACPQLFLLLFQVIMRFLCFFELEQLPQK